MLKTLSYRRWRSSGRHWEKHLQIWIVKRQDKLLKESSGTSLNFGVLTYLKNSFRKCSANLILTRTVSSHTRTFKCQSVLTCSQQKDCISDKTYLNRQKSILVHTPSASSLLKTTKTFVKSIRKCIKMNASRYSPSFTVKLVQNGKNLLKKLNKKLTKTIRVKYLCMIS